MRVAFRVDASIGIGTGHVMRCLPLAEDLQRRGATVLFICRELPPPLQGDLEARGMAVHRLAGTPGAWSPAADADATAAILDQAGPTDWLVVDHYGLDAGWESALRPHVGKIMVIDDLADRDHDCDLILDQNFSPAGQNPHLSRIPANARSLFGPRYALLRPEFAAARQRVGQRDGQVRRILVCFGGSDPGNHTAAVLEALKPLGAGLSRIDVVLGAANPHREAIAALVAGMDNVVVHSPARDLPVLLAEADLAIGAGGIMNWERACLGAPSLVFGIADNQKQVIAALCAEGYAIGTPAMPVPDRELAAAWLRVALASPELLTGLSARSLALVDGQGVRRVADALVPSAPLAFRPATAADSRAVFSWRNDPSVRAVSLDQREIDWAGHSAWFERTLANPDRLLLIAEDGDCPVGVVRFDLDGEDAVISVYRVPSQAAGRRGLIGQATDWLHRHRPHIRRIIAEVLPDNADSLAAFRAAGYRETRQTLAIELEPS